MDRKIMIPRVEKLIQKLLIRPDLEWIKVDANAFACQVGGSCLGVELSVARGGIRVISFDVMDSNDQIIDSIRETEDSADFDTLYQLWEQARSDALKIDDVYNDIFTELG